MNFKKHLPNSITLANLLCGTIATIFAVQGNLVMAAIFVGSGIFLDFFDGLAARMLDVKSELGLQLDSLADMVTSGVVPGLILFQLFRKALPETSSNSLEWQAGQDLMEWNFPVLALVGLLVTAASGYRLAKFNIDDRQSDSFIGLPTPANALLIISLPLILIFQPQPIWMDIILNPWFLVVLTLLSCYMLNAEVSLFALKFANWSFSDNKLRYFFLLFCVLLLVFLHFAAVPLIIVSYVLLSLVSTKNGKGERGIA